MYPTHLQAEYLKGLEHCSLNVGLINVMAHTRTSPETCQAFQKVSGPIVRQGLLLPALIQLI